MFFKNILFKFLKGQVFFFLGGKGNSYFLEAKLSKDIILKNNKYI